jgi:hypothetical protein
MLSTASRDELRTYNLMFLTTPALWAHWPFLPLMRRREGQKEEFGVLCDLMGMAQMPGFSATIFISNLFFMPPNVNDILTLPKEAHDTPEEIYEAGWRVD